MRLSMISGGVATLLAMATAIGLSAQAPAPKTTTETPLAPAGTALAASQMKLIDEAEADLRRFYERGEASLLDPRWERWAWRRVEVTRAAGAPPAERVRALERYLETLRKLEAGTEEAYRKSVVDRLQLHDARYRRIEAELWLAAEKAGRPALGTPRP